MKAAAFIALFLWLAAGAAAQLPGGQWEGTLKMGTNRNAPTLTVRLELVAGDSSSYAVLYTRGVDRGEIFGCDYFLAGGRVGNNLQLRAIEVERALNVGLEACANLNVLMLSAPASNDTVCTGRWFWADGSHINLQLKRTDSVISEAAIDEIDDYFRRRHELYDSLGLRIPPAERWRRVVLRRATPEPEVLIELLAVDNRQNDTVSLYLNEQQVVLPRQLSATPFRLRIQLPVDSEQQLFIANESAGISRIPLRIRVTVGGVSEWLDVEATGTQHATLLFVRKNQ